MKVAQLRRITKPRRRDRHTSRQEVANSFLLSIQGIRLGSPRCLYYTWSPFLSFPDKMCLQFMRLEANNPRRSRSVQSMMVCLLSLQLDLASLSFLVPRAKVAPQMRQWFILFNLHFPMHLLRVEWYWLQVHIQQFRKVTCFFTVH